jgi:hypothetical protein
MSLNRRRERRRVDALHRVCHNRGMRFLTWLVCVSLLFSAVGLQVLAPQTLMERELEQPLRWQGADSALPASAVIARGNQMQQLWLGELKSRSEIGIAPIAEEIPAATFRLADASGLLLAARSPVLLQHVRLQL